MDVKQAAEQISTAYDRHGLIYAIYQHGDGYEKKTNARYHELYNSIYVTN